MNTTPRPEPPGGAPSCRHMPTSNDAYVLIANVAQQSSIRHARKRYHVARPRRRMTR